MHKKRCKLRTQEIKISGKYCYGVSENRIQEE